MGRGRQQCQLLYNRPTTPSTHSEEATPRTVIDFRFCPSSAYPRVNSVKARPTETMLTCLFPCLPTSSSSGVDGKAARLDGTQQQLHSTLPANPTPPLVWPLLGWHCQRQGDVPVSCQCKWPQLLEMSSSLCMSTVWTSGLEPTLPIAMPQDISNYYLMQPHIIICSFYCPCC
jgi:hypothetical protein